MKKPFALLLLLLALCAPLSAWPQPEPVTVAWDMFTLPGNARLAVLWITPGQGYKTYANTPGASGMPTTVDVRLGPVGTSLPVLYPKGKPAADLYEKDVTVNVYDQPTPIFVPLPAATPADFSLEARVSLLACTDVSCWPMLIETTFSAAQAPNPAAAQAQPWWPAYQALAPGVTPPKPDPEPGPGLGHASANAPYAFSPRTPHANLEVDHLLLAIPLAMLAGLILNLMPCVLPVVTLKLSGLLALMASQDRAHRFALLRTHNLYFSLGILGYFVLLAAILGFAGMAWGQIFQRPGLIFGAAVALFALGLSLFGVFHLPVVDLKIAVRSDHSPALQAFLTGFLSTLLATPCSGPFLGGVLAWTLMQPVPVVIAVFLSIGLGMASPFLVMAAKPGLVRLVPRPGPWMEHLEKLAGFMLMATCLYFLTILPQALLAPTLAALLATAFACHAWGSYTSLSQTAAKRWTIRALALALALGACLWALSPPAPSPVEWRPFDPERFSQALGRENMLLDFTADWCPTCKALEKTVLTPKNMARLQAQHNLTLIRVDLTREDPKAMALLRALGSASLPAAALFPAGDDAARPMVLRDLFTLGQLEDAMEATFFKPKPQGKQP